MSIFPVFNNLNSRSQFLQYIQFTKFKKLEQSKWLVTASLSGVAGSFPQRTAALKWCIRCQKRCRKCCESLTIELSHVNGYLAQVAQLEF